MKALVLVENGVLEFKEIADPKRPGDDWARIRVAYAGICQSDKNRGFASGAYHYPLVMGHEFSGVVEEAAISGGPEAGTPVAVFPLLPCRECESCSRMAYAKCSNYDYLGSRRDGAFAEYVWVPTTNLYPVPDGLDLKNAAVLELCAVGLHGANLFEISGGESALIIGDGPLGVMMAQWLRFRGAEQVIVSGVHEEKLALCRELGFETIHSRQETLSERLLELTDGRRVDLVVEGVGTEEAILQSLESGGYDSQVMLVGNPRTDITIPKAMFSSLLRREIVIRGSWNSIVAPPEKDEWRMALSEMSRSVITEPLISHVYPLREAIGVFDRLIEGKESFSKVILQVDGGV